MEAAFIFICGVISGGLGIWVYMWRDWQECKRVAKLMALRLEEDAKAKKAK